MPVEFTPVTITIGPPIILDDLLHKIPPDNYTRISDQQVHFLTSESAKLFMRRFCKEHGNVYQGEYDHDFSPTSKCCSVKAKRIPIKTSQLTQMRRIKFPKYIICSMDGVLGFRVLARDGLIWYHGEQIRISGRMFKRTNFYCLR